MPNKAERVREIFEKNKYAGDPAEKLRERLAVADRPFDFSTELAFALSPSRTRPDEIEEALKFPRTLPQPILEALKEAEPAIHSKLRKIAELPFSTEQMHQWRNILLSLAILDDNTRREREEVAERTQLVADYRARIGELRGLKTALESQVEILRRKEAEACELLDSVYERSAPLLNAMIDRKFKFTQKFLAPWSKRGLLETPPNAKLYG